MTFKVEPDKLFLLSKQLLSHLVRARRLQSDLQREREEINSVLYGSQFRPPFEGEIRANSDNIETMCQAIIEYLECQGAWLSYFAGMAADADNAPLSFEQAEKILAKYDERFVVMTRLDGPRMLAEDPNNTNIPFTSPMGLQAQQEKKQEYDRAMINTYKELLGINTFTRLTTGTEPLTGEKLGSGDYALEAGLTALSLLPLIGGLVRTEVKEAKLAKVIDKTRGELLREKYGRLTSVEFNQRINLRGAVAEEYNRLKAAGLSKKEMGPALAGVLDTKTGKYYFGINAKGPDVPRNLSTEIATRLAEMPSDIRDGYIKTKAPGSHAEIYALNDAFLARPGADPSDFMLHVINAGGKTPTRGMPIPRCPHCEYLTNDVNYFPEVLKYGK
ncbi:YwqJ-related putative deaminase [Aneurinibacillus tyrosinisolvens]|uniref:YwqJ-related putative deaminase n=1 Tax=Aneurinibacillus tyrosinisolvens TaxID=1443435 RepID=UPI000AD38E20|nr:YwqJ-related putative deaminase [Aneurinibacillus tyrosinisolvens]